MENLTKEQIVNELDRSESILNMATNTLRACEQRALNKLQWFFISFLITMSLSMVCFASFYAHKSNQFLDLVPWMLIISVFVNVCLIRSLNHFTQICADLRSTLKDQQKSHNKVAVLLHRFE